MPPTLTSRLALAIVACAVLPTPAAASGTTDFEFFEKKVRPILVERCYECHGADKQQGGLRLDHRAGVRQGGDSGPAITPGEPEQSRLARALSWDDPELQMPPKNQLPDAEIAVLTDWIRRGAPDPRETWRGR